MRKIERLAALARTSAASPSPAVSAPFDRAAVMARIRALREIEQNIARDEGNVLSMPFSFFAGGAAAAAAAALVVAFFAVSAWNDMNSPIEAIDSMFNMMDVL